MLDPKTLIQRYELQANVMREMLGAARLQDWDRLTELEAFYTRQIEQLKLLEAGILLPEADKARKLNIIKAILADDREIRGLLDPWMARLSHLMQGSHMEAKLNRSYGV